jgi:hypothetical protein
MDQSAKTWRTTVGSSGEAMASMAVDSSDAHVLPTYQQTA